MSVPGWVADPALAPVWQRLRASLQRGAATARLTGLDRDTRHALGGLLGRPVTGAVTITLGDLDAVLRHRAGMSLRAVVEHLTGPLPDRAAVAAARQAPLDLLAAVDPEWSARVRASGILSRSPDALTLVTQAVALKSELPGEPRLRTELAAAVTGDAHALDDGRPLVAVLLRAFTDTLPRTPAERRDLWERLGVVADTVSTSVLTLGLRPLGEGPRERALHAAADLGDPVPLTPWALRRLDAACGPEPVLVVENPAVLEAFAVRHGGAFPVVCTAGWPAAVAVTLLRRLDAPLAYHGDFDWRGLEICSWLQTAVGVAPWRMTAADYLTLPGGLPLQGRPVPSPWDPALAESMAERGVAVHQEQILDQLLAAWPRV